ncbi:hypothetical protein [Dictyobacter arantiisoli]|uniref:Uncharacterized protein n=1 Tax=Dictyobacter arantiisoli TaxID=2014874 RepID=A0A5A5TJM9_9CHLR|nr:hypothetical protein [Dictyobacter arantiisoli]GCF11637.1 hypothetical protein KDI_52010 [Dictyobacter arantiisoli]
MPIRPEGRIEPSESPAPDNYAILSDSESSESSESMRTLSDSGRMEEESGVLQNLYNRPQYEQPLDFTKREVRPFKGERESQLNQWPIQLRAHLQTRRELQQIQQREDIQVRDYLQPMRAERLADPNSAGGPVPELHIDEPTYYQMFKAAFNPEAMKNEHDALVGFKYWSDLFNQEVAKAKKTEITAGSKIEEFSKQYNDLFQRTDSDALGEIASLHDEIDFFRSKLSALPETIKYNITSMEANRERYKGDQVASMNSIIEKAQEELGTLPDFGQHINALTSLRNKVRDFLSPSSSPTRDVW